jgi:uracil phosphoribosyltransferase
VNQSDRIVDAQPTLDNVTVADHPLARHYLTVLRDERTRPEEFRAASRRLAYLLLMTATADVETREVEIDTPLATVTGHQLGDIVAVAVLRAGLGLLQAVLDLMPDVKVGYAGVQRDEETAQPQEYYNKLPDLSGAKVLILEPMLATGGSLSWAADKVKQSGATDITALCVVVAPEGAARMAADHPDVQIVAGALDDGLNDHFYIVPGLGDMGDRLFGTL